LLSILHRFPPNLQKQTFKNEEEAKKR